MKNIMTIKNIEVKGTGFELKIGELELSLDMEAEQASKLIEELARQTSTIEELLNLK